MTGWVFDIQHFCTHDGPGIRTTVFMQGCPLRCQWCHNPEGWTRGKIIGFTESRCIGCGKCIAACGAEACKAEGEKIAIDRDKCKACGACAAVCPAKALEFIGRKMTVSEVMEDVKVDIPFYLESEGGLTLSGGEPLLQTDFSAAILQAAKQQEINTCVETCGYGDTEKLLEIAEFTDLFLYDIKHADSDIHKKFTGFSNEIILENLSRLTGTSVRLRLPLIKGVNDRSENIREIAEIFKKFENIKNLEILPYHSIGVSKAERIGSKNYYCFEEFTEKEIEDLKGEFEKYGVKVYES